MDIITLIGRYVEGLLKAGEDFTQKPDRFDELEKTVAELSNRTAADFLAMTLEQTDGMIKRSSLRKKSFNIQRHDRRTLITTVGDVVFNRTLYKEKETGRYRYLLDELIRLPDRERFSELAEAKVLDEAERHSYQHAADALKVGGQSITKTAVMEKVHAIAEELSGEEGEPMERKKCPYLYIEADEDHIHKQKDKDDTKDSMIGKLVYVFEGKKEKGKNKKVLEFPYYKGGLYQGSAGNRKLWEEVQGYIESHYDTDSLRKVYLSGDGAGWIKSGADYIDKCTLIADRFHLMKYIYRVSALTLDEKDITVGKFYKYIYKNKPIQVKRLLTRIRKHCGGDGTVEEVRTYLMNNWESIQRAFHDRHVLGCSAEGHVSHVYSERMSSRPMGWSEVGADRMCRLRCYVRNHGRDKIIDLVRYRRDKEMGLLNSTGTEGLLGGEESRTYYSSQQRSARAYVDKLQATIPGYSVKKELAIRERLSGI